MNFAMANNYSKSLEPVKKTTFQPSPPVSFTYQKNSRPWKFIFGYFNL